MHRRFGSHLVVASTNFYRFHAVYEAPKSVSSYKDVDSVITGVAVTIFMLTEGIDFPFVLGLLAFLLNYIPTLGSILAGVPAVILAFLEFGLGSAGLTTAVYLGVNVSLGQIIEPRLQGQGLDFLQWSCFCPWYSGYFWGSFRYSFSYPTYDDRKTCV